MKLDMKDILGQHEAVAAIEHAFVLGQNGMLLTGPSGSGIYGLARRITSVMAPLTEHEQRWLTAEHGVVMTERPFRAPHHSITASRLIGPAGSWTDTELPPLPVPQTGELHLARFGVLFLADVLRFSDSAIAGLTLALRVTPTSLRPFIVASSWLCPCGCHGSPQGCHCTQKEIHRYTQQVSEKTYPFGATVCGVVKWWAQDHKPCASSEITRARIVAERARIDAALRTWTGGSYYQ